MDFQYTELKYLNFALYSPIYLSMLITLQYTLIFFLQSSVPCWVKCIIACNMSSIMSQWRKYLFCTIKLTCNNQTHLFPLFPLHLSETVKTSLFSYVTLGLRWQKYRYHDVAYTWRLNDIREFYYVIMYKWTSNVLFWRKNQTSDVNFLMKQSFIAQKCI